MRFASLTALAVAALAVPGAVLAQSSPPPTVKVMPLRAPDSAFALGGAYREIGRAEQAGATGHYIDAARTHYRSALARHDRSDDAGAAAEARLASDLARVALDERPPNSSGPRDVPAPPTPRPGPGRRAGADGGPPIDGMWQHAMASDGPMMLEPGAMLRMIDGPGMRMGHGFDATHLAEVLKVETSAEARQLAQNAVDANAAAQKAALAGNVAEASRQTRLSNDLAMTVHDLAVLNHPELRSTMIELRTGGGFGRMSH
jgi:hypothetical protein